MRNINFLKKYSNFNTINKRTGFVFKGIASEQKINIPSHVMLLSNNKYFIKTKSEAYLLRSKIFSAIDKTIQIHFKKLILKGIGFKSYKISNNVLLLKIGYTHKIYFIIKDNAVNFVCKKGRIVIFGSDYNKVNNVVFEIKSLRIPDSYKGKGITLSDEVIKLKPSKKRI